MLTSSAVLIVFSSILLYYVVFDSCLFHVILFHSVALSSTLFLFVRAVSYYAIWHLCRITLYRVGEYSSYVEGTTNAPAGAYLMAIFGSLSSPRPGNAPEGCDVL